MKIYVAAKMEEAERASKLMRRLESQGHEITHDWTKIDPTCETTDIEKQIKISGDDLLGAINSDFVVLLWHPNLKGGLVEMGAALALGKQVALIGGPEYLGCVFFSLCGRFVDEEEFLGLPLL